MKKFTYVGLIFTISHFTALYAAAFKGPNLGGPSGYWGIPSARTSWEEASQIGLDAGFHYLSEGQAMVPKLNLTLFNRWEIGGMYLGQEGAVDDGYGIHTKFRFLPWSGRSESALAIGYRYNALSENNVSLSTHQIYLSATYSGSFFGSRSDTSMVFGKSFGDATRDGDIDFGMGFDTDLFPSIFQGHVHWITDFSNFGFHHYARAASTGRGIFNTGIRIAVLKALSKISLDIDILGTDLLDDSRGFGIGATFGMRL